jgi:hypothetical protein
MSVSRYPTGHLSLAPQTFVFSTGHWKSGLNTTNSLINQGRIIGNLWETYNRKDAGECQPVRVIIHGILPALSVANVIDKKRDFVHDGLPYLSRDIRVSSSVVQWFGSDGGNSFLERASNDTGPNPRESFVRAFVEEMRRMDIVALVIHSCTPECSRHASGKCNLSGEKVLPRDRVVTRGVMHWLGTEQGRAFVADYISRRDATLAIVRAKMARSTRSAAQRAANHPVRGKRV